MDRYIDQFDNCLQNEKAFCSGQCPFGLDVNTFISKIQNGRFNAAYKTYAEATGFPAIASLLCDEPCKGACLRDAVEGGQPIELLQLEKACAAYAKRKDPNKYNLPKKKNRIAVIGGGISGMACVLKLAAKKYDITVFEKTDRLGGSILDVLDPQLVHDEFQLQMQHLEYTVNYESEITSLDQLLNTDGPYDAVYVATGQSGNSFGAAIDAGSKSYEITDQAAVFFGGALTGSSHIQALADGLNIAATIDSYIMTKTVKYNVPETSRTVLDDTVVLSTDSVPVTDDLYTEEQAVEEAKRCLSCQCSACRIHCDLTEYLNKWPVKLRDEIITTTMPGKSELHATPAMRSIHMCTHCGICKDVCPEDIDLDNLILAARARMHKLDKKPWVFNDYFLRDMEFSLSDDAYMCESPVSDTCRYLFFPGCQLGASAPHLVTKSYGYLLSHEPASGIMLGCCGIPAEWAGNEEKHSAVLDDIRDKWQSLGNPAIVLACPTCTKTFRKHLPEIETVFIYDLMAEWGIPDPNAAAAATDAYSIFDPCSTFEGDTVRTSVRSICDRLQLKTEPLPVQEKWSACCSYGGHGSFADPEFTEFVRDKRINESSLPYITYCINCRDSFMHGSKRSVHLLDLVFGTEPEKTTISERRANRADLKETIMKDFFNKPVAEKPAAPDVSLIIDDETRLKISNDYILEEDAAKVIAFCERTGRSLYDSEKDSYTGYQKIGYVTYWVEYKKTDDPSAFELLNAYSHRMEIELEMIWNGEKVDTDL